LTALCRRDLVVAAVAAKPGACFRELQRTLGIPAGSLQHHLRVLVRAGTLRRVKYGCRLCFFLAEDGLDVVVARLPDDCGPLLGAVRSAPGLPQKAVLAASGLPRSTAQNRLALLVSVGLLRSEPIWPRSIGYWPGVPA
jgi:DNA-binding IclR family transcriptional regulator